MRNPGFVQIILLIVFILVPLIKFVLQRVQRRLEDQMPEEESVTEIHQEAQAMPVPQPAPRATPSRVHELQGPTVITRLARSHLNERSLVGNSRDVRRGIIAMTILGPCRAFDPTD